MRRTFHVALALAASLATHSVVARDQRPVPSDPQPPAFRSGVELVQVEVVVTDKDGRPVRGLTKGDFTVLDRRKPQAIDPIRLSESEFNDLVAFVRDGLLDPRARPESLCRMVPAFVPSGIPVSSFQGCR